MEDTTTPVITKTADATDVLYEEMELLPDEGTLSRYA